jgi:hypothetical protein
MGIGLKKEIVFFIIETEMASVLVKMLLVFAVKAVGFSDGTMPYFML